MFFTRTRKMERGGDEALGRSIRNISSLVWEVSLRGLILPGR